MEWRQLLTRTTAAAHGPASTRDVAIAVDPSRSLKDRLANAGRETREADPPRRRRLSARIAALLLFVASLISPVVSPLAAATGAGTNAAVLIVLPVSPRTVRVVGGVPKRWNLLLDGAGRASLVLFMYRGDVTIGGVTRPYEWTSTSVMLDSSRLPAGITSTSRVDTLPSDLYLINWSTSSSGLAAWLRHTGLGAATTYVPGLDFTMGSDPLPTFGFGAPAPYVSPYRLSAKLTPTFLPTLPDTVDYWRDTATGTVKIETNDNNERIGAYLSWTLRTPAWTPLARMTGGTTHSSSCSTNIVDPLLGIVANQVRTGCISREQFSSTDMRSGFVPRA
jgi:hypothetical protein